MCGFFCGHARLERWLRHFSAGCDSRGNLLCFNICACLTTTLTMVYDALVAWLAWRHAGARFLLSGDVWLLLWTCSAGALAPPFPRPGVTVEATSSASIFVPVHVASRQKKATASQ